jgi:hypothetical protein
MDIANTNFKVNGYCPRESVNSSPAWQPGYMRHLGIRAVFNIFAVRMELSLGPGRLVIKCW